MASIQNVRLTITESLGQATAVVTYHVFGSAQDIEETFRYLEIVELIGVDTRPGEDGGDDRIPDGRKVGVLTFPLAVTRRSKRFQLPSSALDEDRASGPAASIPLEDEIRARVTLRPVLHSEMGESNVVTRGGLVNQPLVAEPA